MGVLFVVCELRVARGCEISEFHNSKRTNSSQQLALPHLYPTAVVAIIRRLYLHHTLINIRSVDVNVESGRGRSLSSIPDRASHRLEYARVPPPPDARRQYSKQIKRSILTEGR